MKKWLIRAALAAVLLEVAYLGVANLVLNLPLTQTLINKTRPEKFAVYWDRAWSWYPFRVHARNISANGQSETQQWQADTPAASGSISILPLLMRSVNIHSVSARDIVYYQRPRPRPDKKFAALRKFFPPIRDREPEDSPPTAIDERRRGVWNVHLRDGRAHGSHRFWIYQAQGSFRGELYSDLNYRTPEGPLSSSNGGFDLQLEGLVVNDNQPVAGQGRLKGTLEMTPFMPKEHKGPEALEFVKAVADIDLETDSLAFLNLYLRGIHGMTVDGAGRLTGRIAVEGGRLRPGTDLAVSARRLDMSLLSHRVEGAGDIHLGVAPEAPDTAEAVITFSSLEGFHAGSSTPLFSGSGLKVTGRGATTFMPLDPDALTATYLAVEIPSVRVPDLARYQRYLPSRSGLTLHGGQGELQGQAVFADMGFETRIQLTSQDTDLAFKDYRFRTSLELVAEADCPSIGISGIDIAGTYLKLNEAALSRREQARSSPMAASLTVDRGALKIDLPEALPEDAGAAQRWAAFKGQELVPLLGTEETVRLSGKISDLKWLNLLFQNPYDLSVDGEGELTAEINIDAGWPAAGTTLEILPKELTVSVLDYVATGDGRVLMAVEKGGQYPDVDLRVNVDNARFKRRQEEKAYIEDVDIALEAVGRRVGKGKPGDDVTLDLKILSATVKDMAVFNRYLPPQSPLVILGGQADLVADIDLAPDSAGGFVKMKTNGLQLQVDRQKVSGELTADVTLAGGVPKNMDFDISGSSLLLDKVRIAGARKSFEEKDWHARLDLKKGRALWKKPIKLEVEAGLELSDTRPMVAIISNQTGRMDWLENLLTVEDIRGEARLTMAQDRIVIPYAFAGSEKVDVGAKGVIGADTRDGMFYARYQKLQALLKIKNERRNLDVLFAREKFDRYRPEPQSPKQ